MDLCVLWCKACTGSAAAPRSACCSCCTVQPDLPACVLACTSVSVHMALACLESKCCVHCRPVGTQGIQCLVPGCSVQRHCLLHHQPQQCSTATASQANTVTPWQLAGPHSGSCWSQDTRVCTPSVCVYRAVKAPPTSLFIRPLMEHCPSQHLWLSVFVCLLDMLRV